MEGSDGVATACWWGPDNLPGRTTERDNGAMTANTGSAGTDDATGRDAPGAGPAGGGPVAPGAASRGPLRPAVLRERLERPAGPVDRLEVVPSTGSTNTDLVRAVRDDPDAWGALGVLVTEHQVDGRGRSGRSWQTPPAAALTFSVALRPPAPAASLGWLPLVAGLATVQGIREATGVPATLKWPNDLMVDVPGAAELPGWGTERKVGGILAELVPTPVGPLVVVGIGLNVSQTAAELPVPSAASLAGVGAADPDREALLVAVLHALGTLADRWRAGGDVVAAGLVDEVSAACTTIGRTVRVELPEDRALHGRAVGLAADGALLVRDDAGDVHPVRAGDVRHLRSGDG